MQDQSIPQGAWLEVHGAEYPTDATYELIYEVDVVVGGTRDALVYRAIGTSARGLRREMERGSEAEAIADAEALMAELGGRWVRSDRPANVVVDLGTQPTWWRMDEGI